jgi:hypothetical protein
VARGGARGGSPFRDGASLRPVDRLGWFCGGAMAIAAVGIALSLLLTRVPDLQAALLKFYWFRLADVMVPATVALLAGFVIEREMRQRPRLGVAALAVTVTLAGLHVGNCAVMRVFPVPPRAFRAHNGDRLADYVGWRQACQWIACSGEVPEDARFLTPIMGQTFKWYAGRSEVATLKDIPQDAASIVAWWRCLHDVYGGPQLAERGWCRSLAERDPDTLAALAERYGADYLLTRPAPVLPFERVYANRRYVIYRMDEVPGP